jgi:hypothetical protein
MAVAFQSLSVEFDGEKVMFGLMVAMQRLSAVAGLGFQGLGAELDGEKNLVGEVVGKQVVGQKLVGTEETILVDNGLEEKILVGEVLGLQVNELVGLGGKILVDEAAGLQVKELVALGEKIPGRWDLIVKFYLAAGPTVGESG